MQKIERAYRADKQFDASMQAKEDVERKEREKIESVGEKMWKTTCGRMDMNYSDVSHTSSRHV